MILNNRLELMKICNIGDEKAVKEKKIYIKKVRREINMVRLESINIFEFKRQLTHKNFIALIRLEEIEE